VTKISGKNLSKKALSRDRGLFQRENGVQSILKWQNFDFFQKCKILEPNTK